ncbi:unnamed protein product [Brassica rapa subsp. narinosa]
MSSIAGRPEKGQESVSTGNRDRQSAATSSVNPGRVQVKLLHSWRQKTNYGGDTLEMIFADETGVKIHYSARKTLIKKQIVKYGLVNGDS